MNDRFKTVEIDGSEYVIEKFDAMTGLKLARFLLSKLMPILPVVLRDGEEVNDLLLYEVLGEVLESVDEKELETVVSHCLRACSVNLPAGRQKIMDEFGHYGVDGVEYDMKLVVQLCVQALLFGAADFFSEGAPWKRKTACSRSSRQNP